MDGMEGKDGRFGVFGLSDLEGLPLGLSDNIETCCDMPETPGQAHSLGVVGNCQVLAYRC